MTRTAKPAMLARIKRNIEQFGHHVYIVKGKQSPRFAYTIGVSSRAGAEVVLAGAALYSDEDVKGILDTVAGLAQGLTTESTFDVPGHGTFSVQVVDSSWAKLLILGALDYYNTSELSAYQVVPDRSHWTIDTPDLSRPWTSAAEPAWRWLTEPWSYGVSDRARAVTNFRALRGERVTESMRWEEDQWELFAGAGPDVPEGEIRDVPLGTLLGVDPTLTIVTELETGKGVWRDPVDLVWHEWG